MTVQGVRRLIKRGQFPDVLGTNPHSFNNAAWNITFEWIALSLHLVDRIAGRALDPEKQSRFMHELANEVLENLARNLLTDNSKSNRRNFEDWFLSMYQKRSQLYAPLEISIPPSQFTLFWEAASIIVNAYFPKHPAFALILSFEFPLLDIQLNETLWPGFTHLTPHRPI